MRNFAVFALALTACWPVGRPPPVIAVEAVPFDEATERAPVQNALSFVVPSGFVDHSISAFGGSSGEKVTVEVEGARRSVAEVAAARRAEVVLRYRLLERETMVGPFVATELYRPPTVSSSNRWWTQAIFAVPGRPPQTLTFISERTDAQETHRHLLASIRLAGQPPAKPTPPAFVRYSTGAVDLDIPRDLSHWTSLFSARRQTEDGPIWLTGSVYRAGMKPAPDLDTLYGAYDHHNARLDSIEVAGRGGKMVRYETGAFTPDELHLAADVTFATGLTLRLVATAPRNAHAEVERAWKELVAGIRSR